MRMPWRRLPSRMARRNARAVGIGGVVAPGRRRDGVILHREGEIGPPHRPVGLGELLEGMGTVQLMEHVPVDVDEVAAVGAARHEMRIPDLVEQGLRHGGVRRGRPANSYTGEGRSQIPGSCGNSIRRDSIHLPSDMPPAVFWAQIKIAGTREDHDALPTLRSARSRWRRPCCVPSAARRRSTRSKYPDWSGQWTRPRGLATQWDQAKPAGLGQQAPLTPEYQASARGQHRRPGRRRPGPRHPLQVHDQRHAAGDGGDLSARDS